MIAIKSAKCRKIIKIVVPFLLIPLVVTLGILLFKEEQYLLVSFIVAVLSLVLFVASFEKKKIGTRRLILVCVMIALSVVGRFIPFFKPITAISVITAMYLGSESGFLVGSFSALISNFYFGQGPWTPFQMLAFGMIGLIAGFLSKPMKKNRILLAVYGLLSGVAYSFVMDVWTVLWYNGNFDASLYLSVLLTALPFTALYSASNVLFLLVLSRPIGEKLERVKLKYGI